MTTRTTAIDREQVLALHARLRALKGKIRVHASDEAMRRHREHTGALVEARSAAFSVMRQAESALLQECWVLGVSFNDFCDSMPTDHPFAVAEREWSELDDLVKSSNSIPWASWDLLDEADQC